MQKPSGLLHAIDKIFAHKAHEFIAPIPDAKSVTIHIIQDGIPYKFYYSLVDKPGWYNLIPTDLRFAVSTGDALPSDISDYLFALPRFYVISLYQLAELTWLCIPYNASDAAQRGWPQGQPRPLHLVNVALEPQEVYDARSLAGTMLYCDLAPFNLTRTGRDFVNARSITDLRLADIEDQMQRKAIQQVQLSTEGKIRWQLGLVGAKLIDWNSDKIGYIVTWEYNNNTHTVVVNKDLHVESAGLCLNERDRDYNLAAIVGVIEEGRRLHRPMWDAVRENNGHGPVDMEDDDD